MAGSLQNDVPELYSTTEKPFFLNLNSSDLIESTHFENENTFKPYTTPEEEAVPSTTVADTPDNTNTSIYVEDDDIHTASGSKEDDLDNDREC